jgi:hypothetical protein
MSVSALRFARLDNEETELVRPFLHQLAHIVSSGTAALRDSEMFGQARHDNFRPNPLYIYNQPAACLPFDYGLIARAATVEAAIFCPL